MEKHRSVQQIVLDAEAGQISAALDRRGLPADARVRVVVDLFDPTGLPLAALAHAGKAFDGLADEPDLYSDADLVAAKR